jgi:hypothetical protein
VAQEEGFRVLHIWNTAGVASITAKFLDREFGTRSTVITRKKFDTVGFTTYGNAYDDGALAFSLRALRASRSADIVQVYAWDRIVPWLRRFAGSKPLVMYYVGSEIRGRWKEKQGRWSRADLVAYTTSDLSEGAPPSAFQAFCPVDTDMFHPSGGKREPDSAVSIRYGMERETGEVCKKLGLNLTWVDRGSVPYAGMPELFSRYEYFIDMRKPPGRAVVEVLGKAGLEALASGCKVVDWLGNVHEGLPEENRPEKTTEAWYARYKALMDRGQPRK